MVFDFIFFPTQIFKNEKLIDKSSKIFYSKHTNKSDFYFEIIDMVTYPAVNPIINLLPNKHFRYPVE